MIRAPTNSAPKCTSCARRSDAFWCNFTLGDTLLATRRLDPLEWQGALPSASALQPPVQQIDADRRAYVVINWPRSCARTRGPVIIDLCMIFGAALCEGAAGRRCLCRAARPPSGACVPTPRLTAGIPSVPLTPPASSLLPPRLSYRKLLCTGDLEEVRVTRGGENGGSFPPANMAGAYTPQSERWSIVCARACRCLEGVLVQPRPPRRQKNRQLLA